MKKSLLLFFIMMATACTMTPERKAARVMRHMSTRDKIAQLITISCDSYNPPEKRENRNAMVRDEHVGGLIIMHDHIVNSVVRLNEMQAMSPVPLIVSIDGEWGPSMRYGEFPFFPRQMQLGALEDDSLIYQMGLAVAEECKLLNIYINYAPVADININPNNPVIGTRSFGENKEKVTRFADAYMRGMQDGGIFACAKHFPGHGDTDVDSHKALPILPFTRERLDLLELYPFRQLIQDGVALVMIGHLDIPVLDSAVSTLSPKIVTGLLKEEMQYDGVVVTDALNMKGVSENLTPAEVTLAAYKAGVDLLLMPDSVSESLDLIEAAINSGECSIKDLNKRCLKILTLKAKAGMLDEDYSPIMDTTNLADCAALPAHRQLVQELCDKSMTLVENRGNMVPLVRDQRIAYIAYNATYVPLVRQYGELEGLSGYCPKSGLKESSTILYDSLSAVIPGMGYFTLNKNDGKKEINALIRQLRGYDQVLFVCHDPSGRPKDELINNDQMEWLQPIIAAHPTTLVHFGTPYGLNSITWIEQLAGIMIGYADSENNQLSMSKVLLGQIPAQGVLPVSAGGYKAK